MRFEKIPTILFLLLFPILISLGVWQLSRAEQKRALLLKQTESLAAGPLKLNDFADIDLSTMRYRLATANGSYDTIHQILLDHQVRDGKSGYYVLAPFRITGLDRAVLVNRGWIKANPDRKLKPDLKLTADPGRVNGRINAFPTVGIKLSGADQLSPGWPAVVQVADEAMISDRLGYSVFPFLIELDATEPGGYRRDWRQTETMPPERHQAYALQWFGLALTLVFLFFRFSRGKQ